MLVEEVIHDLDALLLKEIVTAVVSLRPRVLSYGWRRLKVETRRARLVPVLLSQPSCKWRRLFELGPPPQSLSAENKTQYLSLSQTRLKPGCSLVNRKTTPPPPKVNLHKYKWLESSPT